MHVLQSNLILICADEEDVKVGRCNRLDTGFAVFTLAILLYIPAVQNWVVQRVVTYASDKTGMDISVDRVSLVFPLDLGVEGFRMIQQNDSLPQVKDTVADVKNLLSTCSCGRCLRRKLR